jgi:tRNA threonylcarbamoyl adenosine modification protein (Sua5/YciO/YrdC/YwlC family)
MILEINPEHPQPRQIRQVVDALQEGKLVAYPTDTVYGIGCDITNHDAVERLRELVSTIKGEPKHQPLSFICEDLSRLSDYAFVSDDAYRLLKRVLPGAYTFVLRGNKQVPSVMQKKRDTVGIRVPDHQIPLQIVEELGNPIATTSATTADGEMMKDPWSIDELYGHAVDVIIDGGDVFPQESTVIDFSGDIPQLIREGKGLIEDIEYIEVVESDEDVVW